MTVMVDEIRVWPTKIRCFKGGSAHLTADTLEELHAFARRLRLLPEWFQPRSHPHYDLSPEKRERALALGALPVSARKQARDRLAICRAWASQPSGTQVNIRSGTSEKK